MDRWNAHWWNEVSLPTAVGHNRSKIIMLEVVLVALASVTALTNLATAAWYFSSLEQPAPVESTALPTTIVFPIPSSTPTGSRHPECVMCEPHGLPIILAEGQMVKITCRFHDPDRPGHSGVDFSVKAMTEVITTMDGMVTFAGDDPLYGRLVIVRNAIWEAWYAHNAYLLVRPGDWLLRGEIIALSGSTGASSGPHLHYGVNNPGANWLDPEVSFGGQIMQVEFGDCIPEGR